MNIIPSAAFAILIAVVAASPAVAEMPSYAYVGLTCAHKDTGTDDAEILFTARVATLQDGDTYDYSSAPAFPVLPPVIDHGMSTGTLTMPGASADEAECGHGKSRILVRHGANPLTDDNGTEWISVWVGNRKILSRFPITYDDNPYVSQLYNNPFVPLLHNDAFLIIGGKVSICSHQTREATDCKPLGDVASMGVIQAPDDRSAIPPGKLVATFATDRKLCDSLIKQGAQPGDAPLSYLNKPDNRDTSYYIAPKDQDALSFRDAQPIEGKPYELRDENGHAPLIDTANYDLSNSGKPQLVVNVGDETHYLTGNFLVSIPATGISREIVQSAYGLADVLDGPNISDALFKQGWRLFSAKDTQYKAGRYSQMTPGRIEGITYILVTSMATSWKAKGDDSVALLMRPSPDGSMSKVCEYHRGEPIF